MRIDAVRNRAKLVAVADICFARHGVTVSTDLIAKEAGVGIGTVFRHFPTKDDLLAEVNAARLRRLAEQAGTFSTERSPGEAFFAFVRAVAGQDDFKNTTVEALIAAGVDLADAEEEIAGQLRTNLTRLLDDAQHVDAVRDDLGFAELRALLVGIGNALGHAGPDAHERVLSVFLDGMRPQRQSGRNGIRDDDPSSLTPST
ncbi:TetR/AcrR family transcriptional regulator [Saccharothrix violaceirubra]|uniref:AcrR family transcriptional regulator n=1 Tax=Saccharothrix violaceirubra TaxID=413306 RepID=A0A7W7SYH7_9PSEU|nr:TetR/AcrR family transcriptional regulator [Saccharothrix violaceirubra]MBB4963294.1 AcrR family transcriptional regulator [Saccharothrix violaceirubra]